MSDETSSPNPPLSPQFEEQDNQDWRAKAEEYLNNWKRTAADFDNYRKRRDREDQELVSFARQATIIRLLPALEALTQALEHAPVTDEHSQWSTGIAGIRSQLDRALSELGVQRIPTVGEKFNHELHEAVEMIEGRGEPGTVVETVADGYTVNGHVIRPAKVKVAR